MLTRVFTLAFEPMTRRFNDDPVRDFIADKNIASIRDHFFLKDDPPYLALVLPLGRPGRRAPHRHQYQSMFTPQAAAAGGCRMES